MTSNNSPPDDSNSETDTNNEFTSILDSQPDHRLSDHRRSDRKLPTDHRINPAIPPPPPAVPLNQIHNFAAAFAPISPPPSATASPVIPLYKHRHHHHHHAAGAAANSYPYPPSVGAASASSKKSKKSRHLHLSSNNSNYNSNYNNSSNYNNNSNYNNSNYNNSSSYNSNYNNSSNVTNHAAPDNGVPILRSIPTTFSYLAAPPIDLLPPVNVTSLKEIDLQEIFKNPQLRHDIVFDPQLQFRPNLDGERGKRKRASTERYWDGIIVEIETLVTAALTREHSDIEVSARLPYLFTSIRDVLDGLLPSDDRGYVRSVLDPDLLLRQLRHCALDFVALGRWLSTIFKAHCAPMRDSWVDQMMRRIEKGVKQVDPSVIVEGLRMVFAILEAMKLDVANHQIRTLRPVLIETAVEFEQGYYGQIIDRGKIDITTSLDWFVAHVDKFRTKTSMPTTSDAFYKSAFCLGLTSLLGCGEDSVTEFPNTFGFDFTRLADFRAELRQIVCMKLCLILPHELARVHSRHECNRTAALSEDDLRRDILAIISDAYGNPKWTKNTQKIALHIASAMAPPGVDGSIVPSNALIDTANGWLAANLQPKSKVYRIVEAKIVETLFQLLLVSAAATGNTGNSPTFGKVSPEVVALSNKLVVLVDFHWGVFSQYYTGYARDAGASAGAGAAIDSNCKNEVFVKPKSSSVSLL